MRSRRTENNHARESFCPGTNVTFKQWTVSAGQRRQLCDNGKNAQTEIVVSQERTVYKTDGWAAVLIFQKKNENS